MIERQNKTESHDSADEVARHHDALTIHPVEHNARKRPRHHSRDRAGKHDAGDDHSRFRVREREAEDGDVVEVIADFADDLARPHVAIVAVLLQKLKEARHQPRSVSATPARAIAPPATSGALRRSLSSGIAMSVASTGCRYENEATREAGTDFNAHE